MGSSNTQHDDLTNVNYLMTYSTPNLGTVGLKSNFSNGLGEGRRELEK